MTALEKLRDYVRTMMEVGASDLHLRVGSRPIFRVNTKLGQSKNHPELTNDDLIELAHEMFNEKQKKEYELKHEMDLSLSIPGLSRCRVNVFQQIGKVTIVRRMVPNEIKTIDELH